MKILMIVVPHLRTGGGQKLALDIATNVDKERFRTVILSLYPSEKNIFSDLAQKNNIEICYLNKKPGIDLKVICEIYGSLRKYNPDIVHAHLQVMPYLLFPLYLSNVKVKLYTVHNIAEKDAHGINQKILNFAFHKCGVTPVAISDLCKKTIVSTYNLDESLVPCIYNGIKTKLYSNDMEPEGKKLDMFTIINVGRFQPQKNHMLMLKVFKRIHDVKPNTQLVLVGDGELHDQLKLYVDQNNLTQSVKFKGIISTVSEELSKADIYLMTSDWEGLPLSVLEAMAAGLPIIATKAGGVIDIVCNGKNGFLHNIGDEQGLVKSLLELINNHDKLEEFSRSSREMSQEYDISNCVSQYELLYLNQ